MKYVLLGIVAVILLTGFGLATDWFGLVVSRPMQKYAEETRVQVYDTSRTYQQGTNADLYRYCSQYKLSKDAGERAVLKDEIRTTLGTFNGQPNPNVNDCLTSIGVN